MAHCVLWEEADWQFAIDTIQVHAAFIRGDYSSAATELRNREKVLGTTLDFRRDLRIRYVPKADEGTPASVTAMDDYRKMLEA
jgi:hypothetical protein